MIYVLILKIVGDVIFYFFVTIIYIYALDYTTNVLLGTYSVITFGILRASEVAISFEEKTIL